MHWGPKLGISEPQARAAYTGFINCTDERSCTRPFGQMARWIRAVKASDTVYSINVVGTPLEVRSGFSCVRDSISVGEAVVLKGGCLVLSCLVSSCLQIWLYRRRRFHLWLGTDK